LPKKQKHDKKMQQCKRIKKYIICLLKSNDCKNLLAILLHLNQGFAPKILYFQGFCMEEGKNGERSVSLPNTGKLPAAIVNRRWNSGGNFV